MKSSTLLVLTVSYLAITSPPLLIGCIDDGTTGTSSASSSGTTSADAGTTVSAQACEDTCTALANAQVACGQGDFAALKASAVSMLAGGNCNSVTIMDQTSLYNQCIPSLSTISCVDLASYSLDSSCAGQIIRP